MIDSVLMCCSRAHLQSWGVEDHCHVWLELETSSCRPTKVLPSQILASLMSHISRSEYEEYTPLNSVVLSYLNDSFFFKIDKYVCASVTNTRRAYFSGNTKSPFKQPSFYSSPVRTGTEGGSQVFSSTTWGDFFLSREAASGPDVLNYTVCYLLDKVQAHISCSLWTLFIP